MFSLTIHTNHKIGQFFPYKNAFLRKDVCLMKFTGKAQKDLEQATSHQQGFTAESQMLSVWARMQTVT